MIGFLKGKATHITSDYCLLVVHDVGYRVFISNQTRAHISPNAEVMLYIHTNVREDAILLYGFFSREEYDLFLHLIGISGIGPKVAQGILSSATANDFYRMVQQKDVKGITKLPGIGKKTAERILLELKMVWSLKQQKHFSHSVFKTVRFSVYSNKSIPAKIRRS